MATQIALAVVLLIGAGLVVRSYSRLVGADLGVKVNGVLAFSVSFEGSRYQTPSADQGTWLVNPIVPQTMGRIWEGLRGLPGVESAAGVNHPPFTGNGLTAFAIDGQSAPTTEAERQQMSANYVQVTPDYFSTMAIPVRRGRVFLDTDLATSPWALVVNERFARVHFGAQNPIGHRILLDIDRVPGGAARRSSAWSATRSPIRTDHVPTATMYALYSQQPAINRGGYANRADMTFLVRAAASPAALGPAIRHLMGEIDRDRPVLALHPLTDDFDLQLAGTRYIASVSSLFALVATLLAAAGIYGVIAYAVGQRTREFGIRMALGAGRGDVLQLVARQVMRLMLIGLAVGISGALALSRFANFLVAGGVAPTDAPTFIGVAAGMAAIACVAALIPALRAVSVAPTVALRSE